MARQPKLVRFDGNIHWFSLAHAASLLRTTRRKLASRAVAGEFKFEPDKLGLPEWLPEPEITAARGAKLAAEKAKMDHKPRPKTAKQLEAEWAKISAKSASTPRDSAFTLHHLRLTLPREDPEKDPK
jgi:hypothetical protein